MFYHVTYHDMGVVTGSGQTTDSSSIGQLEVAGEDGVSGGERVSLQRQGYCVLVRPTCCGRISQE